jgi:transcriptional regulator with XRE-family HTH domain
MPVPTPAAAGEQPPHGSTTIPEVLGANIRAYRLLKELEQEDLAARMRLHAHPWRRATVSEVERARRNVTVPELVTWS